jgi:hypothetical protein
MHTILRCKITTIFPNMQDFWAKKKHRTTFARENFLRIGFEACFFLCNPTTSSLPFLGHGVEYRHAISEAFALG